MRATPALPPLRAFVPMCLSASPVPPRHSVRILLGNHQKSTPPHKTVILRHLRSFPAKNHMSRCAPSRFPANSSQLFAPNRTIPLVLQRFPAPLLSCFVLHLSSLPRPFAKFPAKTHIPLRQFDKSLTNPAPSSPAPLHIRVYPRPAAILLSWSFFVVLRGLRSSCLPFRVSDVAVFVAALPRHIAIFICRSSSPPRRAPRPPRFNLLAPRTVVSPCLKTSSHKKDSPCTAHKPWPSSTSSRKNPSSDGHLPGHLQLSCSIFSKYPLAVFPPFQPFPAVSALCPMEPSPNERAACPIAGLTPILPEKPMWMDAGDQSGNPGALTKVP
jgi:hypothetical protein